MQQPPKNFLPGNYKTIVGDSINPHSGDNRVILSFFDLNGKLESDLPKRLAKKWIKINNDFRGWYRGQLTFKLGNILPIAVQTDTEVICMLVLNESVIDLAALKDAMIASGRFVLQDKKNVHINKCEENWPLIESMLNEYFIKSGINVTVYTK